MNKLIATVAAGAVAVSMATAASAQQSYRGNIYKDFTDRQTVSTTPNGDKIVRSYRGNKKAKGTGTLWVQQGKTKVRGTYVIKDGWLCETVFGETNCYRVYSKDPKDPRPSTVELRNKNGETVRKVTIARK